MTSIAANLQAVRARIAAACVAGEAAGAGALAHKLKSAARAVGAAVGANPLGIVIPCHRVIGADGRAHDVSHVFPTGRKPVFRLRTR